VFDLNPLSFERAKESLAKKTLPLVKNCRKLFHNGCKNFNSSPAKEHCRARQTGNFCFSHCS
ncbi:MAG: hypothetical protein M3R36_18160, partial [Bacteroidota bacterium]|nr:hypothetical protein [Bacteroidota bacterium]